MFGTQNETLKSLEPRAKSGEPKKPSALSPQPSAFTLVELLVVITIIGILAALITGAALNAMNKAKQAAITMELQQMGAAMENLKTNFGTYPPNAFTSGAGPGSAEVKAVRSDVQRAIRKAFPRINSSELALMGRLIGDTSITGTNAILANGLSGSEAIVFWLGGFSKDPAFPISGAGGPSHLQGNLEVLEDRNWAEGYEFDLGRLGPRDGNGQFMGRKIEYTVNGQNRRINFWTYSPSGSQEPVVYFDTSNVTPIDRVNNYGNYDLQCRAKPHVALDPSTPDHVVPIRKPLETVTTATPTVAQTKFLNQGKFQILHCGTDDIWGDFSVLAGATPILSPEGPFIGDIADTVGSFLTGTLEDEQE